MTYRLVILVFIPLLFFTTSCSDAISVIPFPKTSTTNTPQAQQTTLQTSHTSTLKGDLNCQQGEPDCNVCANNVEQQFNHAVQGKLSWQQKPWRFNWDTMYPPNQRTATSLFNDSKKNWLGIADHHIQGFMRTNSNRYPYAGSHSHLKTGGVFLIEQHADGKKHLKSLHTSKHRHPSGVQILGNYLLFGDDKAIRFVNVEQPNSAKIIKYELTTQGLQKPNYRNFGGGIGMARLTDGRYLILSSVPGAQDERPRFHRFYLLEGNIEQATSTKLLAESRALNPKGWAKKFTYSENLSLITECKTGTLYAIHSTGDETGINALVGSGYWRLSKLTGSATRPQLTPIRGWQSQQNIHDCHIRSTGTVYVNRQHQMEFYCHGYAKNKANGQLTDKFYFKVAK